MLLSVVHKDKVPLLVIKITYLANSLKLLFNVSLGFKVNPNSSQQGLHGDKYPSSIVLN